jgi:hypothetical protein
MARGVAGVARSAFAVRFLISPEPAARFVGDAG